MSERPPVERGEDAHTESPGRNQFDDLADSLLQHPNALVRRDHPDGTPHPEWEPWAKSRRCPVGEYSADLDIDAADVPGVSWYPGDLPYDDSTFRLRFYERLLQLLPVDQADIQVKGRAVATAFDRYLPPAGFLEWIDQFNSQFQVPKHYDAISASLDHILSQFNSGENPDEVVPVDLLRDCLEAGDPDVIRAVLKQSDLFYKAPDHPELLTAFAFWQGSYTPYLENARAALCSAHSTGKITANELKIALSVLEQDNGPLEQLDEFNIYGLMTPLTLLAFEDILAEGGGGSREQVMLVAITRARKQFTKLHLMTRVYGNGDVEVCPAYRHFLTLFRAGILENGYTFAVNNRDNPAMQSLTTQARETAQEALRRPRFYHFLSIGRDVQRSAGAFGGRGLFPDGPPSEEAMQPYLEAASRMLRQPDHKR